MVALEGIQSVKGAYSACSPVSTCRRIPTFLVTTLRAPTFRARGCFALRRKWPPVTVPRPLELHRELLQTRQMSSVTRRAALARYVAFGATCMARAVRMLPAVPGGAELLGSHALSHRRSAMHRRSAKRSISVGLPLTRPHQSALRDAPQELGLTLTRPQQFIGAPRCTAGAPNDPSLSDSR